MDRVGRRPTQWEKIFANSSFDRGLTLRVHFQHPNNFPVKENTKHTQI